MAVEHANLVQEKLDQAAEILREQDVDLWLTLVRETLLTSDPCLELIAGTYSAWTGAFLISAGGERTAIVGRFDAPSVEEIGAYEVIGYDESIRPALVETVERLAPRTIALNYSDSDAAADGLTHGLWRLLQDTFAGTPYAERFTSSEAIVNALRGRKSPAEVERIRRRDLARRRRSSTLVAPPPPTRPQRARDRRTDAGRDRAERARVRVEQRPLPGRQRRPREGGRPHAARRAHDEARRATTHRLRRLERRLLQRPATGLVLPRRGRDRAARRRRARVGRAVGVDGCRRRGARAGRRRLGGRRRSPQEPRRGRLPGADVRARPPARPLGARRRHGPRTEAGIATAPRRSASSKRGTSSRSSTGPPCRAAATSASRRTCSSPRTGSSGSRRRSASSGSSPPRRASTQRAAPRPRSDRATRRALQRRCRSCR